MTACVDREIGERFGPLLGVGTKFSCGGGTELNLDNVSVVVVRRGRFKRVGQAVVAVGALLNLVWRVAVPVHGGKKYRIRKCDFELLHV